MISKLKRLFFSETGSISIEFALVLPVLIGLYLAVVEYTGYLTVSRRAEMANNSMAQVLAESGVGNEDSMHQIRQIARIMNPTGSIDGEVPYSFSQILFEQADPACTSNCEIVPARDFIFSDRLDSRSCDVHVLSPGEKPDSILEIPSSIDGLAIIVIVVGHQVDYKPIFGARVIESLSDGAVNIKRYAYSVRHTGEAFSYPNNASAFYQDCT